MPEILETDICVIGAGSGGLSVAAAAAGFGVPVVLIEKGRMGGDCLNYGCVPSKALIAAARRAADFATSAEFGVDPDAKEAIAFAVLAHRTWRRQPGNLPSATGASHPVILGKVTYGTK